MRSNNFKKYKDLLEKKRDELQAAAPVRAPATEPLPSHLRVAVCDGDLAQNIDPHQANCRSGLARRITQGITEPLPGWLM